MPGMPRASRFSVHISAKKGLQKSVCSPFFVSGKFYVFWKPRSTHSFRSVAPTPKRAPPLKRRNGSRTSTAVQCRTACFPPPSRSAFLRFASFVLLVDLAAFACRMTAVAHRIIACLTTTHLFQPLFVFLFRRGFPCGLPFSFYAEKSADSRTGIANPPEV